MTMKAIRTEKATLISTTKRHAARAGAREDQPVLDRHEPDHLADCVTPRHHYQKPEEHDGERKRHIFTDQRAGAGRHAQHQVHGQRDKSDAEQHRQAGSDGDLDLPMQSHAHHHAAERHRDDDALEAERDHGRHIEIGLVLDVRLPCDRQRQEKGMQGQDVDQRQQPVLVKHHEADEDETAGEHMGDVEGQRRHHMPPDTNSSNVPSRPSISAIPSRLGTRNTRILAMTVSSVANSRLATITFRR